MTIELDIGEDISLTKESPGLRKVIIGLGWGSTPNAQDLDIDLSAFLCDDSKKVLSNLDFIFYNNRRSADGTVLHLGEEAVSFGDQEALAVDLVRLHPSVRTVICSVSIYAEGGETLQRAQGLFLRVLNGESKSELAKLPIQDGSISQPCVLMGEVYRLNYDWRLRAVAQPIAGLGVLAQRLGVALDS